MATPTQANIEMENVLKAEEPNFLSSLNIESRVLMHDKKVRRCYLKWLIRSLLLSVHNSEYYNEKKEKLCSLILFFYASSVFTPDVVNIIKRIDEKDKETEGYHNSRLRRYIERYFDDI